MARQEAPPPRGPDPFVEEFREYQRLRGDPRWAGLRLPFPRAGRGLATAAGGGVGNGGGSGQRRTYADIAAARATENRYAGAGGCRGGTNTSRASPSGGCLRDGRPVPWRREPASRAGLKQAAAMPGQRDLSGWRRGPGAAQGGPGPGQPQGGPGAAHNPPAADDGGDHTAGDDDGLEEGPPPVKEEFPVPRRARQAQVQAEASRQRRAEKLQEEAIKREMADSKVLDPAIFEAEVQFKAVGLSKTPGFEHFDQAALEELARAAMARQGVTPRPEVGPEAFIKQEMQAQKDQLALLKSIRRQLTQLGKWQVYAQQARCQIDEWTGELSSAEDRVKSIERHVKEAAEGLPLEIVKTELGCNPTQSEAVWRAVHRRDRVAAAEWEEAATPQGGGSESGEPGGFQDFLGEVVHGGMVPEDRAKRKARAETEPAASRVEPAVQSHRARRSATPTRRMRPEAVQALAAVHAAEQRQDGRSSEQQLEDHLRAAALARGQGVTSPVPLALNNAYGPLQRPSDDESGDESMVTTDADAGHGSDRSRGSRGTRRSGLARRAKAMQRRTVQASASGVAALAAAGAAATSGGPGTILGYPRTPTAARRACPSMPREG